jgi:hypothetical protein
LRSPGVPFLVGQALRQARGTTASHLPCDLQRVAWRNWWRSSTAGR